METNDWSTAVMEFLMKHSYFWLTEHTTVICGLTEWIFFLIYLYLLGEIMLYCTSL